MNKKLLSNIVTVVGVLMVVAIGYYLFFGQSTPVLRGSADDAQLQALLQQAQEFSLREQQLQQIRLDTTVLTDRRFVNLQNHTQTIESFGIGRPNPFSPITDTQAVSAQ